MTMKFSMYLLIIASLLFFETNDANASQCALKQFDETVEQADIIFMGKVIKRDSFNEEGRGWKYSPEQPQCGSKVATFEIYKVWKGDIPDDTTTVYSTDGCYGLGSYFSLSDLYIVFANTNSRELPIDASYGIGTVCDGTTGLLHDDERIIKLQQNLDTLLSK